MGPLKEELLEEKLLERWSAGTWKSQSYTEVHLQRQGPGAKRSKKRRGGARVSGPWKPAAGATL